VSENGARVNTREIVAKYESEAPHRKQARAQVLGAVDRLSLEPPSGRLQLPWPAAHAILSYMVPGQLIVLTAQTASGKTTFLHNLIDAYVRSETVKIAFLGLEQSPEEHVQKIAALRVNVDPAIAAENSWLDHHNGEAMYDAVREETLGMQAPEFVDRCRLLPQRYIGTQELEWAALEAEEFGANVLIVDHIHHISHGNNANAFAGFSALVQQCKRIAEEKELVMLVAAQINRESTRGDALARYRAPKLNHIQGGGTIEQVANKVLGLWRPLRNDLTAEDFKALKAEKCDIKSMLEPNTMAMQCLKNRERGNLEGARAYLRVERGKVSEIPEKDRAAREHGIRTGGVL
jgi:replicative DNA helicase